MNSRLNDTEECISDLEDRIMKSLNQNSRQKDKWEKKKCNKQDLWDETCQRANICMLEREKGIENVYEEID